MAVPDLADSFLYPSWRLSLMRYAIAMSEAQARGLAIADQVSLVCELSFMCLAERAGEPEIEATWGTLGAV